MPLSRTLVILFMTMLFSGCAMLVETPGRTEAHRNECIVSTSLAGTIIGSFVSPLGAGAGALTGNGLGHYFCVGEGVPPASPETDTSGYFWPDDQDADGVSDADDRCPFTPEGVTVESDGCANDNDGDGVPDYLDQCPETPLGTVVDINGCGFALVELQDVHFAFDSASLTAEAKSILDQAIIATIQSDPSQNIQIEGHTDSTGPDSYNLDLSQRRAQFVVDYLTSKGIGSSRLEAKGYGENSPISSNDTSSGRAENRRVEIFAR